MICRGCSVALLWEKRIERDGYPSQPHLKWMWETEVVGNHAICMGRCDCRHEGFMGIVGPPSAPLYHGGIGGLQPGAVLSAPVDSGWLRAQTCMTEVGLAERNKVWLVFKESYKPGRVYCTRVLSLALRHAAGVSNWNLVTGASQAFERYGSVYRVKPLGPLFPDIGNAREHCCLTIHDERDQCAFFAQKLIVTEVVVPVVKAKHQNFILNRLDQAYSLWHEANGGVHWWQRNQ